MDFSLQRPDQRSYKFNEVVSLSGIKPYVLRFWESEFEQIEPITDEFGNKVYTQNDLNSIQQVKGLLFDEKLSIPEAKAQLDLDLNEIQIEMCQAIDLETGRPEQVATELSSLEKMRSALAYDMNQKREQLAKKQFLDQDVLNLVQAKKKLNLLSKKLDSIIDLKNWNPLS